MAARKTRRVKVRRRRKVLIELTPAQLRKINAGSPRAFTKFAGFDLDL
jgi:hypothetical protein